MTFRILYSLLVCVCAAHGLSLSAPSGSAAPFQAQPPAQARVLLAKHVQCFGLARKTRQLKIDVPVLYNVKTRQTMPIPKFLYYVDENVIMNLENEGWEVRRKAMYVPQHVYARVPVCCPWDQSCSQGSPATPTPDSDGPGPLLRALQPASPYQDMVREAELWRQRVFNAQQQAMNSPSAMAPMLSPRDHLLSAVSGPWAQQAAMWHQQVMRAKMAQLQEMYRQSQGNPYGQMPQQGMSPIDLMRIMQARGGNPYSAMDDSDTNPYNAAPSPAQLNPNMVRAFQVMQQEMMRRQGMNPSGGFPQGMAEPDLFALIRRMQNQPQPMIPFSHGQSVAPGGNPYSAITPYNNQPPQLVGPQAGGMYNPQARTPMDMDPFSQQQQQQGPGFMNDPRMSGMSQRERQLMAMALFQRMLTQQRARAAAGNDVMPPMMNQPRPLPPLSGFDLSNQSPQAGTDGTTQNEGDQDTGATSDDMGSNVSMDGPLNEQPQLGLGGAINGQPPMPMGGPMQGQPPMPMGGPMHGQPPMSMGGPMQGQPPMQMGGPMQGQPPMQMGGPMQGQPPMQMGGPMQGQPPMSMGGPMGQQPQMPTPEEMQQIQQCQGVLEPKLNECLKDQDLTLEQFMNPEYMEKARAVCEAKETVGPCIMQLDKVCGEETVEITRKMIGSVLQMMGMICEQIMARGDAPIPPMQQGEMPMSPMSPGGMPMSPMSPGGMPMSPMQPTGMSEPPMETGRIPQPPLGSAPPSPALPPTPTSGVRQEAPMVDEENMTQQEALPPTQSSGNDEFSTAKHNSGLKHEKPASSANVGHDAAHPVSQELQVLGYPLWLIITLALVLFVALLLAVVVVCMCVRRRRRTKTVELEIEKKPVPLDSTVCTIGIPPPSYTTTAVQQTEDGLALPPLDLNDDSSSVAEKDTNDEKPPLEEDDADDESDEKTDDDETKKKKAKNDKN